MILDTWFAKNGEYGQTIIFCVNKEHCITLAQIFNDRARELGLIKESKAGGEEQKFADFVISDTRDMITGVTTSSKDNDKKIKKYRKGELKILTNVNILTEGTDLPQTKTVFLARPTVSTVLMTQMIGRALRGEKAGGTSIAYVVPFIDDWKDRVAWVSPESLYIDETTVIKDDPAEYNKRFMRLISIKKIEEFASIMNDMIDTSDLEAIDFEKRIPIGMYAFQYSEKDDGQDISYQVMVYDSTKKAYEDLMEALPELFSTFGVMEDEYLDEETIDSMEMQCRNTFFLGEMIPSYQPRDVKHILRYYAQNSFKDENPVPQFYTFEEIDRNKLDVAKIAQEIRTADMRQSEKDAYLDKIWDDQDNNLISIFFGRKLYFLKAVEIELNKIVYGKEFYADKSNVVYSEKSLEDLPLYKIREIDPELEKKLRDSAFAKAMDTDGMYKCAICGFKAKNRLRFQVDHIDPMNKGGKSVPENLQILCMPCNLRKGGK